MSPNVLRTKVKGLNIVYILNFYVLFDKLELFTLILSVHRIHLKLDSINPNGYFLIQICSKLVMTRKEVDVVPLIRELRNICRDRFD